MTVGQMFQTNALHAWPRRHCMLEWVCWHGVVVRVPWGVEVHLGMER